MPLASLAKTGGIGRAGLKCSNEFSPAWMRGHGKPPQKANDVGKWRINGKQFPLTTLLLLIHQTWDVDDLANPSPKD
jgi:hypothetical protein